MTKIWARSANAKEYTEARIVSQQWFQSGFSAFDCAPASVPLTDLTLEIRTRPKPADFFEPGTMFTVSDRLKAVIEASEADVEFFPVRVVYKKKEYTERAFYFCNILRRVDCFDLASGRYTFWEKPGFTNHVDRIERLAIDEAKAEGHGLFRIARGGETIVGVSDLLASRIGEGNFTGVRMIRPEDWTFGCMIDD